ncbi:MAG: response regulator [Deltaproteobacteria bacterium]|nr:response regulator [Deltaproteobacteria bacterium]
MNSKWITHTVEILLVEDNPADVMLTREAIGEWKVPARLHVAVDGVEALAILRHQAPYQAAVRPDLILLDLNLPRKDGREVLSEAKSDPVLRHIPVIVLTTSQAESDIRRCYELNANAYVVKAADLDEFFRAMHSIEEFWCSIVRLPPYR